MSFKSVVVHPERCVGCMQCMIRCSEAHSESKILALAISEEVLAKPRIHIGVGPELRPFPNKCRHCDPAPCQEACMPGAIISDPENGLKLVDMSRCIGCGMCGMVCPYFAVRYHPAAQAPGHALVAIKCDGCQDRVDAGGVPACVEACVTGALEFADVNREMNKGVNRLANAAMGVSA